MLKILIHIFVITFFSSISSANLFCGKDILNKKSDLVEVKFRTHASKKKNADTIILVHGLSSSQNTWNKIAQILSENFNVVTYDQRGHGTTHYEGNNFDSMSMAKDLKSLVDKLELKSVHLVGHSMGGRTVARFASEYPELTKSVTVEDMHMKGRKTRPYEVNEKYLSFLSRLPSKVTLEDLITIIKTIKPKIDSVQKELTRLENMRLIQEDNNGLYEIHRMVHNLRSIEEYSVQALNEDLTTALTSIKAKTLFIAADPIHKPVLFGKGIEHIIEHRPDMVIKTIEKAGHGVHGDKPQEFVQSILDFLNI